MKLKGIDGDPHKKAENAKKGSLASKANMVKKFNEND